MTKKKEVSVIHNTNCLNCGYPFKNYENFCPECGQENKDKKLTFLNFIQEVFGSLFSWDTRFWRTLFPLLFIPGKVTRDYVNGKRMRYTNPFRFYITSSLIFFLILGVSNSYLKIKGSGNLNNHIVIGDDILTEDVKDENVNVVDSIIKGIKGERVLKSKKDKESPRKERAARISINDSIRGVGSIGSVFLKKMKRFVNYQKNNPDVSVENALDSLAFEKTAMNRFWYVKSKDINAISEKEGLGKFGKEMLSHIPITIFILLPIFALFLKLLYIRRASSYVSHLIFVFHIQTVSAIVFSIAFLGRLISNVWFLFLLKSGIVVFLVYMFIAMKRFYGQSIFKTWVKYSIINITFLILISFGIVALALVTFMIY